jgi:hypothetical protein
MILVKEAGDMLKKANAYLIFKMCLLPQCKLAFYLDQTLLLKARLLQSPCITR